MRSRQTVDGRRFVRAAQVFGVSVLLGSLAALIASSTQAQPPRLAQETRLARIEITDVLAVPRAQCGRAPAYATVSAEVLTVEEGPPLDADIRVRWLACGMPSLEALRLQLIGHRFRVWLVRDLTPSDRGTPEGNRAPHSIAGEPEPIL